MHRDGANGSGVLSLTELEIEGEEMRLLLSAEGPLTRLNWVEDSLVVAQLNICSFWKCKRGQAEKYANRGLEMWSLLLGVFAKSRVWVNVRNDLAAGESAGGEAKTRK